VTLEHDKTKAPERQFSCSMRLSLPGPDLFAEDVESDLYAEAHRRVDRILLTRTLEETDGNLVRAARRLGIGRETLRRRLREVGIHLSRRVETEEEG